MAIMDFPNNPVFGDIYTNDIGVDYVWNGYAWITGDVSEIIGDFDTLGGVMRLIRELLQDTDKTSGEYRYTDSSIVNCLNMGVTEMYRLRPDIFLERGFAIPLYHPLHFEMKIGIEKQYIPPLVYYAVGLTQARDDEQNQDARAQGFLKVFQTTLLTVSA